MACIGFTLSWKRNENFLLMMSDAVVNYLPYNRQINIYNILNRQGWWLLHLISKVVAEVLNPEILNWVTLEIKFMLMITIFKN